MSGAETGVAEPARARAPDLGRMSMAEFLALMGLAVSTVALSIDAMLPALPEISERLALTRENDQQLIVTVFLLGIAGAPIVFGLAADAFGRRPAFFASIVVACVGAVLAASANDLTTMLIGRFLQGFGAGGPRTLVASIVRDRFEGAAMARAMSIVMSVFILTPALAPMLGLAVLHLAGDRATFLAMGLLIGAVGCWAALRMPETLAPAARRPLTLVAASQGARFALSRREVVGYGLASGFALGEIATYVASVEQLLGRAFGLGDAFVLVFGALALGIGAASMLSAAIVARVGMRRLALLSLGAQLALALTMLAAAAAFGPPSLLGFLVWSAPSFFCLGLIFGPLSALAMRPLGAMAGLGAALVASLGFLVGASCGIILADRYDGTAIPLAEAFALCAAAALALTYWAGAGRRGGAP